MVIPPAEAAAIMLPVLLLLDVFGLVTFRGKAHAPNLRILLPAAVAGIIIGAVTLRWTSDAVLRGIIGFLAVGFVLQGVWKGRRPQAPTRPSIVKGSMCGALSGFTSFIANAGGPPFVIYMVPQRLDKIAFAGTAVIFFAVVNVVKVIPFAWLGLFDSNKLSTSLVLLPFAPFGYWLGLKVLSKIDQILFYRVVSVALFAAGCKSCFGTRARPCWCSGHGA
jgi:uncharacterized membrane protein YfcA